MIRLAPHSELLDLINDDGQTAMHCAVYTGQPQVVRQLRAAGAKVGRINLSMECYIINPHTLNASRLCCGC